MTTIRAHYDGKVIVPDEPVDLAIGRPIRLLVEETPEARAPQSSWEHELAFIEELRSRWVAAGKPATPAWTREDLYE